MLSARAKMFVGCAVVESQPASPDLFVGHVDCFAEAAMLANHPRLGAPWATPAAALIVITFLGAVCTTGDVVAQEQPSGPIPTFVVTSPKDLRVPPPPDEATTAAELRELKELATQRDRAVND
jgi:hypothetical protein